MTKTATDSEISGLHRAAVLLVMIGEETAAQVYHHLPEQAIQTITEEISTLNVVEPRTAKQVLEEYVLLSRTQEYIGSGGYDYASRLLVSAYGEDRAQNLMKQFSRNQELSASKLDSLQKADPQQLAKFLQGEHPQTIALILGHMETKQAAGLLMRLPEQTRGEAVMRLAQLRQFSPEMAEKVSTVLNKKLQSLGEQSRRTYAGFKSVADLMNRLDTDLSRSILENIEHSDPKLAINIRNLMFTFEDFLAVTEVAMRDVVANVDKRTLALALKGATEDLRAHIFHAMSSRAVDMLKEDMEALGPVRSRDVTKAQQEIVDSARQLESEGKIVLKADTDDEYLL